MFSRVHRRFVSASMENQPTLPPDSLTQQSTRNILENTGEPRLAIEHHPLALQSNFESGPAASRNASST
jgi:hypothetical protein